THFKPDGDALGSTIAVDRALSLVGVEAKAWYYGSLPNWADQVTGNTPHKLLESSEKPTQDADAVLILDTGSWAQLAEARPWLKGRADETIVIDHHLSGDPEVGAMRIIDTSAAAVCETVASLCVALLDVDDPENLPPTIAEPLYLGIATDTGWFRYSNVTPTTLRLAAALLEAGTDQPRVFRMVELCERVSRLRLMATALASLEFHNDGSIALMSITQKDLHAAKALPGDASGFADLALAVASVRIAGVLSEAPTKDGVEPRTKISLRSKALGDDSIDVNQVAGKLGGGGHARAAGARTPGTIAEVKAKLLEALR
ncbi:MAG: DHH family phosphoesterase, partial [Planctomycetes bacterium]|nr:DHH family phosphoesterase [Planctomycetota bacterium]